ncbi:hypothetical protein [Methylophilus sp.]|uniref:hypothetical protein n=1 Tax=Methylophilus sp. TaxID=29541 RepID=UPI0040373D33
MSGYARLRLLKPIQKAKLDMKHMLEIVLLLVLLNPFTSSATEVTDCFDKAYAHSDNGGLGLNRGQAIELCNGAKNATEVLVCYESPLIY